MGKLTLYCNQGATFRRESRWRSPILDLECGDPILDAAGNVLFGPPISLTGYTGRMQVRATIGAATALLDLTTENGGIIFPQPDPSFVLGWCRAATVADHGLTGLTAIDGITPVEGDRILVKAQTAPEDNGVYVAAAGAWARASDVDTALDLTEGATVWVREGSRCSGTTWRQTSTVASLADAQTWVRDETIGVFVILVDAEDTATLTTSGVYDLELISSGGVVDRPLEGKFRLSKETTRPVPV